jgi:hypothetical protein
MDRVSLAHTSPSPAKKQKQINVPFSHAPSGLFYSWYNWFIRLDGHKIHPSTVLKKVRRDVATIISKMMWETRNTDVWAADYEPK